MSSRFIARLGLRWLPLLCMAVLIVGLPVGCAVLQHKERELVFRIEPGTAGWYTGLPKAVQEFELRPASFKSGQNIHGWWYPAANKDAPAILYLHGVRWNLTGQLFRIEQLHALGFSVLAIDYRGFGQSHGDLPSETTVYEDARIAWERFQTLQPDPGKRLIYGHSLGGAVAIDLAAELGKQVPLPVRGLVIESTFTSLADVATAVSNTSLPVRWLLSQKFDSIDKIADIHMPLLVVHGLDDRYVPPRFSQQLFEAAQQPKHLLLVPGASHNNSMSLAGRSYGQALDKLMHTKMPDPVVTHSTARDNAS
ncbi:alpha/beta hydrolase [Pseudomonas synxantha]|uniref:Alpha/beta hydrolase n=2 Tax=Pseudomonas fluorescens group TaxID=136843 RepID=A0ABR5MBD2_9PSED|nr:MULTISPECIES: alpha/beta hydrolase [Pseudomonas]AKA81306.1 putative exported protein [Pseudomonas synxantha]AMS22409.1 alpha/beta hydrolase [Pseudomonas synxantha]KPG76360.1 alpha/beta hydrolase [Pseudomonas libanensis]KRA19579.1 alpha/beta hydrolase [Pseudomonas sp. Root569]MDT3233007.1 alpha/beta hydrolase [Pseudomonas sp. rhizo25]